MVQAPEGFCHVRKSVPDYLLNSACNPREEIHVWYANLKRSVGADSELHRQLVKEQYLKAIMAPRKNTDPIAWVRQ